MLLFKMMVEGVTIQIIYENFIYFNKLGVSEIFDRETNIISSEIAPSKISNSRV